MVLLLSIPLLADGDNIHLDGDVLDEEPDYA